MDRQMNAAAHDLAARNAVAWTFAKNDPTAVADAAMVSAAVTKSLATWPDVGPRRQPWMTLTPQERAVEMEAFRLVEEREPQTWRAMVLRHLLFQRRATPATINAIANFYGRENDYDSAQNAAAVCSHLAKLPKSPDSDSGLALLTRVVENMPQPVPDDLDSQGRPRDTGILPSGLLPTAPRVLCISVRDRGDAGLLLPGQTSADPDLPLLPFDGEATGAPLLRLVDAAGVGGMQPGRGARLDKRVLIYALLSMPIHARRPGGRYDHRRPLRWWVDKLFPRRPNGQTSYRPVKDSSRILAGLEGLIHAKIQLQLPDGTQWRPTAAKTRSRFPRSRQPTPARHRTAGGVRPRCRDRLAPSHHGRDEERSSVRLSDRACVPVGPGQGAERRTSDLRYTTEGAQKCGRTPARDEWERDHVASRGTVPPPARTGQAGWMDMAEWRRASVRLAPSARRARWRGTPSACGQDPDDDP